MAAPQHGGASAVDPLIFRSVIDRPGVIVPPSKSLVEIDPWLNSLLGGWLNPQEAQPCHVGSDYNISDINGFLFVFFVEGDISLVEDWIVE